jgi:hypothetical protein
MDIINVDDFAPHELAAQAQATRETHAMPSVHVA